MFCGMGKQHLPIPQSDFAFYGTMLCIHVCHIPIGGIVREKHLGSRESAQAEKRAFLSQCDLFQRLTMKEFEELEHVTTMLSCQPGRMLYRPGEMGTALFLLKEGQIQLYHLSTDGRKLIIATLKAGDSCGEMSLIGQRIYDCFAETVTNAHIYVITTHDLEPLLQQHTSITQALLQKTGERLISIQAQLVDVTFKSVSARLATLLLHLATMQQDQGKQVLVVHGFSHGELADRLGVYRETVSSSLRELKESGAIELGRKHITICRPSTLEGLAEATGKSGR